MNIDKNNLSNLFGLAQRQTLISGFFCLSVFFYKIRSTNFILTWRFEWIYEIFEILNGVSAPNTTGKIDVYEVTQTALRK